MCRNLYQCSFLVMVANLVLLLLSQSDAAVKTKKLGSAIVDSGSAILKTVKFISKQGAISRSCLLTIKNKSSKKLWNPQEYIKQGVILAIPPDEIPSNKSGSALFGKLDTKWVFKGSIGMISYSIADTTLQLVIVYKVPWDKLAGNNAYNVKIGQVRTGRPSKNIMKHYLKKENGLREVDRLIIHEAREELGYKITIQMTNSARARLFVEFDKV